MSTHRGFLGDG